MFDCFSRKLFLARFRSQPEDNEKGETYMRKKFEAVREREGTGRRDDMEKNE